MPQIVSKKINGTFTKIAQLRSIYTEDTFTEVCMKSEVGRTFEKKIKHSLGKLSNFLKICWIIWL